MTVVRGKPNRKGAIAIAPEVATNVIRNHFDSPGFAVIGFEEAPGSKELRQFMVDLKEALSERMARQRGKRLLYLSMGRFNQKETTRFHLDGSPDEAYLMLGYEPSVVQSEVQIADYSKAAFDLGLTPKEFLRQFNPMYQDHQKKLTGYITKATGLFHDRPGILLVNNSSLPYDPNGFSSLGVMHQAGMAPHREEDIRIVNSTMIGVAPDEAEETIPEGARRQFLQTDEVAGVIAGS